MNRRDLFPVAIPIVLAVWSAACGAGPATDAPRPDPWALPPAPPASVYDGPLFTMSHAYPQAPVPAPDPMPWREAIDFGRITVSNAAAYTEALKDYIAADMRTLLFDYAAWSPDAAGWYNQPWLSAIREPIHGMYLGSTFPPEMFPRSGLADTIATYVAVYYDRVAATSLQTVWGRSGMDPLPGLEAGGAQFPEGSIIVKPAFTTASGAVWPPMKGAFPWRIYAPRAVPTEGDSAVLQEVYLFQLDIIVKDAASAPGTAWVFTTLVYDGTAPGDAWDKMVPLGAMWGNDPEVASPEGCDPLTPGSCPALAETWINAAAPLYAKETLGWGGRLSGPNDGAVDIAAAVLQPDGGSRPYAGRYAMSSCMSCHGTAEYPAESFLLPSPASCEGDRCTPTQDSTYRLVYYPAGSDAFRRWFQSRPGDEPQDAGAVPLDYGMVYGFKSIPAWFKATQQPGTLKFIEAFNNYRGLVRERFQRKPAT